MTHGWPGSFVEFLDVVGPLTDPRSFGGDPADAFHVVVPTIPGFGFSGPTTEPGWTNRRVAQAWVELMDRLGYDRFGAQGGDLGAMISPELGRIAPDRVVGVHLNAAILGFIPFGPVDAADLATFSAAEKQRLERLERFRDEMSAYRLVHETRPQTLAFALTDSPAGQLAWIVEKFKEWTHPEEALPDEAVGRDVLLTNVMLYWLTGTAASSARIYYENRKSPAWPAGPGQTPTGVAVFAQDFAIRRYGERSHHVVHWSEFDRGGHFAALEAPDLLVDDVRAFFRKVRSS